MSLNVASGNEGYQEATEEATRRANQRPTNLPSIITVEVIGYGGGNSKPETPLNDEKPRAQDQQSVNWRPSEEEYTEKERGSRRGLRSVERSRGPDPHTGGKAEADDTLIRSDGPVTLAWQACSVDVFNKVMKRSWRSSSSPASATLSPPA